MAGDASIAQKKKGYQKIEASCRVALGHNLQYLWCDTCCIDKSSSTELSEAINSMYEYYSKAKLCIAYLDNVENEAAGNVSIGNAKWFTRGWTLQELIAPRNIRLPWLLVYERVFCYTQECLRMLGFHKSSLGLHIVQRKDPKIGLIPCWVSLVYTCHHCTLSANHGQN
jgi:hypothetical protein